MDAMGNSLLIDVYVQISMALILRTSNYCLVKKDGVSHLGRSNLVSPTGIES